MVALNLFFGFCKFTFIFFFLSLSCVSSMTTVRQVSMLQWQIAGLGAGRHGSTKVQSRTWATRSWIPLLTGAITKNLHFLLFIVCRSIYGEMSFKRSFVFISCPRSCYLCRPHIQRALLICLNHPTKSVQGV